MQPVALTVCCMDNWCVKAMKHMSMLTGRRDMTQTLLKTAINPNQFIFLFDQYLPTAYMSYLIHIDV